MSRKTRLAIRCRRIARKYDPYRLSDGAKNFPDLRNCNHSPKEITAAKWKCPDIVAGERFCLEIPF